MWVNHEKLINKPDGMTLVGLTGGIAAGKSEVAKVLLGNGIPVIYMDKLAKSLYAKNLSVYQGIVDAFGRGILDDEARVDHAKLAAMVFNNPDRLQKLNRLVHPAVFDATQQKLWAFFKQGFRIVALESALLFAVGLDKDMDFTVEVTAGQDTRLERAVRFRGLSRTDAMNRIRSQSGAGQGRADYILPNNGDMQALQSKALYLSDFLKHRYIDEVDKDG